MVRILIVDDDADVRDLLRFELEAQGWTTREAACAAEIGPALHHDTPDLILLDLRLPDGDGLAIAQRLRAGSQIPIIMLTGLGGDIDRILGLEMGADDYVVKPFNPRELIARIKAVLRRSGPARPPALMPVPDPVPDPAPDPAPDHDRRGFAGWTIDLDARVLERPGNAPVALTNAEFLLLETFVQAPRRVLSRDQLLERTRTDGGEVFDRTIDVLILRLRRKIEPNPKAPTLIRTERGAGYVFDADVSRL
ncbi:transcriptional regulator [Salipiger aestuarii]|uniref:Regulatory protein VirG n=1 Tax=Salipiger aestuarii TaxID=568098 RepID=A0A327XY92_9RHOB|nr:response regulator [Salipiger aestuarii]EIE48675.1 winged helix family two component transcriptional regulator [Citreicella sp. 357]KAA8606682.1 transcriptional regulator [Salipiger aestuarii]KAA8610535.1 transcriptional regulator [Salipiger aestuarii]KAB2541284.1 transcriptional regulator [Salipiger aestuarii]RAK13948.1 two-component system OmpR family response regulator [Salipiger aestuarii]